MHLCKLILKELMQHFLQIYFRRQIAFGSYYQNYWNSVFKRNPSPSPSPPHPQKKVLRKGHIRLVVKGYYTKYIWAPYMLRMSECLAWTKRWHHLPATVGEYLYAYLDNSYLKKLSYFGCAVSVWQPLGWLDVSAFAKMEKNSNPPIQIKGDLDPI